MILLKLTSARDGATVYVNPDKIQAMARRPEFDGLPVHTAVTVEHCTLHVLEKPADIVASLSAAVIVPVLSPADAPERAASPR